MTNMFFFAFFFKNQHGISKNEDEIKNETINAVILLRRCQDPRTDPWLVQNYLSYNYAANM